MLFNISHIIIQQWLISTRNETVDHWRAQLATHTHTRHLPSFHHQTLTKPKCWLITLTLISQSLFTFHTQHNTTLSDLFTISPSLSDGLLLLLLPLLLSPFPTPSFPSLPLSTSIFLSHHPPSKPIFQSSHFTSLFLIHFSPCSLNFLLVSVSHMRGN